MVSIQPECQRLLTKIRKIGLQIESPNWQIEMLKSSPMHNSGEATKLSHLVQPAEGTIC